MDDGEWHDRFCPECSGPLVLEEHHIVCSNCGRVFLREHIPPEEASVGYGESTGAYTIGGVIGSPRDTAFRDAEGEPLPDDVQARFTRLKTLDEIKERINRAEAENRSLRLLHNASKLLTLNQRTLEESRNLFKMIVSDSQETANYPLFAAVSILFSVHSHKTESNESLDDIVSAFGHCGHRISVRSLVREALRLRTRLTQVPPVRKPEDYLDRVLSVLMSSSRVVKKVRKRGWEVQSYEQELRDRASDILNMIQASKRLTSNPFVVTAASTYAADRIIAEENQKRPVLTQRLISSVTEIAEHSIRDDFSMILTLVDREKRKQQGLPG